MTVEPKHVLRLTPVVLVVVAFTWWLATRDGDTRRTPTTEPATPTAPNAYAGSAACKECHPEVWEAWSGSHHALAEVPFDASLHGAAFEPEREVKHGSLVSTVRKRGGIHQIVTLGAGGTVEPVRPTRIIGVAPLWQAVVAAPGGRYQVTELAYDPAAHEWFDVYGDEDRRPDEWGFWANRGMTWNSMCASCHTTNNEKNWHEETDSYDTAYLELGVGCEACHGAYGAHVEEMHAAGRTPDSDQPPGQTPRKMTWPPAPFGPGTPGMPERPNPGTVHPVNAGELDLAFETCGSCHARRGDLTGRFRAGERFFDHYRPTVPDTTEIYYPDGQVHEEDFEFTSFLSSRMYSMGVRCIHCHEPHGGKLRATGNDLCLGCHQGRVDPDAHSHHEPGTPGSLCVDCHMPLTTYMQRHPRRDHGFTIPDPLLTKEHGIPNACTRCHTDQTVDWAIETADEWYGDRMDRPTRHRARTMAKARRGDDDALDGLLALLATETSGLWRAAALGLTERWVPLREDAANAVARHLDDPDAVVRGTAARVADSLVGAGLRPSVTARLAELLEDPVRLVRVDAAWTLRRQVSTQSRAGKELLTMLRFSSDQPTGALQRGAWLLDRAHLEPNAVRRAIRWLERATTWDANSAPLWQTLAIAQSRAERPHDAVRALRRARELAPDDPSAAFSLALALREVDDLAGTVEMLEKTCELDREFGRAWYNLALARAELDQLDGALVALDRAQALEPRNADFLFARATMLDRLDRLRPAVAATEAAEAALQSRLDQARLAPPAAADILGGIVTLIEYRHSLYARLGDEAGMQRTNADRAAAIDALRALGVMPPR